MKTRVSTIYVIAVSVGLQALGCNDGYWPAIESLCTVNFALGDYGGTYTKLPGL